ncbi:hypothetical protein NBRGN_026_00440 [Nocardia brasiliensis NBRC 14402]|uniref:hypothetical protein n=1 Tax=Nocardia brasiliensis TaxID=37326 RepID=UPI00045CDEDC|nr:hypothetical protein [Nocardia brasiliensis]GAJ80291.1 hypothetical protein NBRGN_026_00440 [Nocardia brasiliensis NBRC 14402]
MTLLGSHPCLLTDDRFGMVTMPRILGYEVSAAVHTAPVMLHTRSNRVGFLVRYPADTLEPDLVRRLDELGVMIVARGNRIMLPHSDRQLGWSPVWVVEPGYVTTLPIQAVVLNAVCAVAGGVPSSGSSRASTT